MAPLCSLGSERDGLWLLMHFHCVLLRQLHRALIQLPGPGLSPMSLHRIILKMTQPFSHHTSVYHLLAHLLIISYKTLILMAH